ncbi:MAG: heme NO-binding domain-containing protein [Campylobacterota bacterium]|nr:heme NO-binding domain-containing protein [Campylobacterota bacterium]
MKGVVFTQFLEMVEEKFGYDINDEMIESSGVSGVYTQAGNYPATDLMSMVKALSNVTKISENELIYTYGKYMFPTLIKIYPEPVKLYNNSFEFISNVEKVVHPEVKKLYPDSDLPTFELVDIDTNEMKIIYKSSKPLMDFAKGLMAGCAVHYGENIDISYEKPSFLNDQFQSVFTLVKK